MIPIPAIRYEITGEWSGYYSHQARIAHREYTKDKDFAEKVKNLRYIMFTDNTTLGLRVRKLEKGEKANKNICSYSELIRKCISQNENCVANLKKEGDSHTS